MVIRERIEWLGTRLDTHGWSFLAGDGEMTTTTPYSGNYNEIFLKLHIPKKFKLAPKFHLVY